MVDWQSVRTVFLDMDGTLLDLRFDNYFWLEHLPRRYAEMRGAEVETARRELIERYARVQGTLDWYCVDYWSRELDLDIVGLKREVQHLISLHPRVLHFLGAVRSLGKRLVLLTNAHPRSVDLKMRRTRLAAHLDALITSHRLGVPKEEVSFWGRLQKPEPFDPDQTLLVDDSLPVLRSARQYGIRNVYAVLQPDTRRPARTVDGFPGVLSLAQLIPT